MKNQLEVQKVAEAISEKNYAEGYRVYAANLRRQYLALIVAKLNLVQRPLQPQAEPERPGGRERES